MNREDVPPMATRFSIRPEDEVLVLEFFYGNASNDTRVAHVAIGMGTSMRFMLALFEKIYLAASGMQGTVDEFNKGLQALQAVIARVGQGKP